MAKASQYPAMTALTGAERLLGVQATATETVTLEEVAEFASAQVRVDIDADVSPVLAGLGYLPPVPYETGLSVPSTRFTVTSGGFAYAPVSAPFTTSGAFNPAQWRLLQGLTASDLAAPTGSAMLGFTQSGTGAVPRTVQAKQRESVSVFDFMTEAQIADAKAGTELYDLTAPIQNALTSGAKHITFEEGRFKVSWPQQTALATFTGQSGITIDSKKGAVLRNVSAYTMDPPNPYSPVFLFDNCQNVTVTGIDYEGDELADPATEDGHKGATFVRAVNGSNGITVSARLEHIRYGVQSGSYPTASDGYCKNFRIDLRTDFAAYPIALYLADHVRADLYALNPHRGAYLAGVNDADVRLRTKNQYGANCTFLMTDSYTGPGTSRGCSNIKARVQDLGSDRTELTYILAGILASRDDDGIIHENIDVEVYAKSTDTISQSVSAFQIFSLNWKPTHTLRNIKVSGLIDKGAQTTPQATGTLYVITNTGASSAVVSNFRLDGLTIIPSQGEASTDFLYLPGLIDAAHITNCALDSYSMEIIGNGTAPVIVTNSKLGNVISATLTQYTNAQLASLSDASWGLSRSVNTKFGETSAGIRVKQTTLNLTGASVSWSAAIPPGALVLGVSAIVTQTITGATGFRLGIASDTSRYASKDLTAIGTTITPADQPGPTTSPQFNGSGFTSIVAEAKTSNFTGGQMRVAMSYIDLTAPGL